MKDRGTRGSVQIDGRQETYAATVDQVAGVIGRFKGVKEVHHWRKGGRAFDYRIDRFDGSGYGCQIFVAPREGGGSLVTVSAAGWDYNWNSARHGITALRVRRLQRKILVAIGREIQESTNRSVNL